MTTDLLDLQAEVQRELERQRGSLPAAGGLQRISTKGKRFTMPDGTVHDGPMQAIVVDYIYTNSYFPGVYNPNNTQPPDCSATGRSEPDLVPRSDSPKVQAEACAKCPKNEWGSGGGNSKACKNGIRLAIVPPTPNESMTPWSLDLAPTSLTGYVQFVRGLQGNGMLPFQMIVELDFDKKVDYPKITFKAIKQHDQLATVFNLRKLTESLLR